MNYILFTAALVYSFYRCPQLHLYASVRRCTPASANPVLYTLYLYLYTNSSQCKSQFAHKGESSNWGKTRNMGRGLCRGNIQNFDKTFFGTMTSSWFNHDNILMWHHYDVNMKDTKHGRLPLDGGHQEVFSFFLSKTSFINAGRAPKKFFRTLESLDFHIIEALAR